MPSNITLLIWILISIDIFPPLFLSFCICIANKYLNFGIDWFHIRKHIYRSHNFFYTRLVFKKIETNSRSKKALDASAPPLKYPKIFLWNIQTYSFEISKHIPLKYPNIWLYSSLHSHRLSRFSFNVSLQPEPPFQHWNAIFVHCKLHFPPAFHWNPKIYIKYHTVI